MGEFSFVLLCVINYFGFFALIELFYFSYYPSGKVVITESRMVNTVNTLLSLFNTTNTLVGQTAGAAGPGGHGAPGLLTPHLLVPLHISGSVRLHHEVVAADSSGHCDA